jgi:maltodextrin utilization protein YvdJ
VLTSYFSTVLSLHPCFKERNFEMTNSLLIFLFLLSLAFIYKTNLRFAHWNTYSIQNEVLPDSRMENKTDLRSLSCCNLVIWESLITHLLMYQKIKSVTEGGDIKGITSVKNVHNSAEAWLSLGRTIKS